MHKLILQRREWTLRSGAQPVGCAVVRRRNAVNVTSYVAAMVASSDKCGEQMRTAFDWQDQHARSNNTGLFFSTGLIYLRSVYLAFWFVVHYSRAHTFGQYAGIVAGSTAVRIQFQLKLAQCYRDFCEV